ncbi:MAG: hypothetical protein ACI81R_002140 [Bradymonadia bacterium]|jgi:hypothetical protein
MNTLLWRKRPDLLGAILLLVALGTLPATAAAQSGSDPEEETVWVPAPRAPLGLALVAPACAPESPTTREVLAEIEALIAEIPMHRVQTLAVDAPQMPDRWEAAALSADGAAVESALVWLRWLDPRVPALSPVRRGGACTADVARLLTTWVSLEARDRGVLTPFVDAVYQTHDIPDAVTVSLATHVYLRADAAAMAMLRRATRDDNQHVHVDILASGAEQNFDAMTRGVYAGTPWQSWVQAEMARLNGRAEQSVRWASIAIDADPFFAAALLTRSAARMGGSSEELALSDLDHLQRSFSSDGPYGFWISRLSSRLR